MAQEEEDAQEVNPSLGLTGSQTAAATVAVDPRGGIPLMLNGPARPSMLMEVEKSLDLSSDAGIVGRATVQQRQQEISLDLKGRLFTGKVAPCNSFLLVEVATVGGQQQAKIVSVANSLYAAECDLSSMINEDILEGTMDQAETYDDMADVKGVAKAKATPSRPKGKKKATKKAGSSKGSTAKRAKTAK